MFGFNSDPGFDFGEYGDGVSEPYFDFNPNGEYNAGSSGCSHEDWDNWDNWDDLDIMEAALAPRFDDMDEYFTLQHQIESKTKQHVAPPKRPWPSIKKSHRDNTPFFRPTPKFDGDGNIRRDRARRHQAALAARRYQPVDVRNF